MRTYNLIISDVISQSDCKIFVTTALALLKKTAIAYHY